MSQLGAVNPVPTDEEAVAIAAAVQMLWPQAGPVHDTPEVATNRWRFSGRWWAGPTARSRQRP